MSDLLVAALVLPWIAAMLGLAFPRLAEGTTLAAAAFLAAASLFLAGAAAGGATAAGTPVEAAGGALRLDALGAWTLAIVAFLGLAASAVSIPYLRRLEAHGAAGPRSRPLYHVLLAAFLGTMALVPAADNLGVLWIAVEATTLASVFLVGFERRRASIEAAWKYVVLCSVGLGFALLATALFAASAPAPLAGTEEALRWSALADLAPRLDAGLVRLAFAFALVGYGTKAGLAPMHVWLPDAHSQAPSPVSGLLSGALLQTSLYALVRMRILADGAMGGLAGNLLLALGILSLGVAALFLAVQTDLKRLLAYSSVEHIGVMAVGLGLGTYCGAYAALLHCAAHAAAKGLAFFAGGEVVEWAGSRRLPRLRGAITALPVSGSLLFAAILALAGLPPFGLFFSEILLILGLFLGGRPFLAAAAAVLLALAFAGLVFQAGMSLWGRPGRRLRAAAAGREIRLAPLAGAGLALCGVFLLLGFWIPSGVERVLHAAAICAMVRP